ncbi:hypothetical protein MA16_Dca001419 [Dendrobium catenatum]|uniref:RRM domain-containing protein n=1 Tax=Dendrobium catenatum TaxID=906689 RepID=A0A2I0WMD1_9ASPA|nr:hypothetical protein MA16_Dca001419 [Dendrobium catenatum]
MSKVGWTENSHAWKSFMVDWAETALSGKAAARHSHGLALQDCWTDTHGRIFHTPLVKPHLSNYSQVEIPRHEESKHSKGYAFIQYCSQEDAILAVEEIDRKWINGRLVYAEIAKPLHGIAYPKTSGPPLQQSSVSNESRN